LGQRLAAGDSVEFLVFDERLEVADLDASAHALAESADLLYISTHGECRGGTYRAILHAADWEPSRSGLGNERPLFAVFDTCDLVDPDDENWQAPWTEEDVGRALRLILGFASPATVSPETSARGAAFAQNLAAGQPVARAWLSAVHDTGFPGTDVGIAIALGDDEADAESVLRTATASNLPAPRTSRTASIACEMSH
jgi:hypothetical protein